MSKHKLFLLRHGEGTWNKENRFCSWVDQKLSENGVVEAQECGRLLKEQGYQFDQVFTSILSRSIQTAWLVLEAMGQEWVPVTKSWRLNERHYGALIGLNRAEMALNHGEEQVKLWRRSYDITPPPIEETHPFYAEIYNDRRYSTCDVPQEELPKTESLKEVLDRLLPYWNDVIVPVIKSGQTVLISAHGNSCRALLKHLEGEIYLSFLIFCENSVFIYSPSCRLLTFFFCGMQKNYIIFGPYNESQCGPVLF
uniref:Phosphoglycerate mutase n=1 Tax=Cyprinus carpio carpio TaxID=630221 RepID=A0A9J7XR32_CYPCA